MVPMTAETQRLEKLRQETLAKEATDIKMKGSISIMKKKDSLR